MAASKPNDPNAGLTPEAKEAKFLYLVLTSMAENSGRTDYAFIATAMGLKNASTACTRFGQIKRKLAEKFGDSLPNTPTSSAKNANATQTPDSVPKKGGKKRKAEDDETPTKKRAVKIAKLAKADSDLKETKLEDKTEVNVKEEDVDYDEVQNNIMVDRFE